MVGSPRTFEGFGKDREQRKVRGWREHHPYEKKMIREPRDLKGRASVPASRATAVKFSQRMDERDSMKPCAAAGSPFRYND